MDELINFNNEYGIKVAMFIGDPKHAGTVSQEEAKALNATLFTYTYGNEATGEQITLYWAVNPEDDTILLARYTYFGSPALIAACDMLALLCKNKTVQEATTMTYTGLERFLRDNPTTPALPECEQYVITLALDAVKHAAKAYYKEALTKEELMYPCKDTPMNLASIKESIKLHDIETLKTLTAYTKAGYRDTSCQEALSELLFVHKEVVALEKETESKLPDIPFRQMDTKEKIVAINKAIDKSVRQFLVMDGGDIEILDVKENGKQIDIYVRYLGACSGCASSSTGTLFAIENTLKEQLDDQIRVLPI
ncbi:MAG TPA: iron-sulfur cluster assembly scaffold protein NifU [Epsilonproteobacteria bacterium]|nr:iron-sulfur cluster assembly scaffold protein NifU [Campylobacterota bacterium]